jgi:prepilin-type N-terminal cleavage/methylation domain-containing protein
MKVTVQERESCFLQPSHVFQDRTRAGLTLIELLVTISVMATVAGMFVIAYRGAATEANNIKTAATIRKINEVLNSRMQEYENARAEPQAIDATIPPSIATGYRYRTSPIPGSAQAMVLPSPPNPSQEGTALLFERARLFALRQTIVQELPDHPDDLKWTSTWYAGGPVEEHIQFWLNNGHVFPTGLIAPGRSQIFAVGEVSARTRQLIRRLSVLDPVSGNLTPIPGWESTNANAELLYLIIEDSTYSGSSAIELFGRSEIRDTDNDGLNEFVDTYGNPIRWIRWPSGSDVSIRSHPDLMDPVLIGLRGSNRQTFRSDIQGDPLDRSKADPGYASYSSFRTLFGLRPLIVSPGADRRFGLNMQLVAPIAISSPFPMNRESLSLGDVPLGVAPQVDLPYSTSTIDCYVADPWYPRNDVSLRLRLGALKTNSARPTFNPNYPLQSDYYDVAADATDNITNLETGGGAL